jgi:hypothetical protein
VDDNHNKDEVLDREIQKLFVSWDNGDDDFVQQLNQLRATWAGWRGGQIQLELWP